MTNQQQQATGRRKTASASVYITPGKGKISINKRPIETYFPIERHRNEILRPLNLTDQKDKLNINANIKGGGNLGQAEALRLGISRALLQIDPNYRTILKPEKLLKRDPRVKERKKPGLRSARRPQQFSKR